MLIAGCISIPALFPLPASSFTERLARMRCFRGAVAFIIHLLLTRLCWAATGCHGGSGSTVSSTPPTRGLILPLNSFDAMQFTIRFSESHDRFYLAYPRLFTESESMRELMSDDHAA